MKHFPFTPIYDFKMGTAPMKEDDALIEIDEHYLDEIQLKRNSLSTNHSYYFNYQPESSTAQWDVVEKIIDDLTKFYPQHFSIHKRESSEWHWSNKMLKEDCVFTFGNDSSLPLAPLDWIGRQVQEDLIILNTTGEVVAGQLCFPSGWALDEKLGKQFMEVHGNLPKAIQPMIQSANKLTERIPLNKPIVRNNWGFRLGNQLDMSTKNTPAYIQKIENEVPHLTMESIGEKIFVRVEHQVLTRLPLSNYILFSIHTYHTPLREVVKDYDRGQIMIGFLKTVPYELIEYKLIDTYYEKLIEYLTFRLQALK